MSAETFTLIGIAVSLFLGLGGMILATTSRLEKHTAGIRTELKADISDLRTELKSEIHELRAEVKTDIDALRTDVKALEHSLNQLDVRIARFEGPQRRFIVGGNA